MIPVISQRGTCCAEAHLYERTIANPFFWTLCIGAGILTGISFAAVLLSTAQTALITACALAVLCIAYSMLSNETKKLLFCEFSVVTTSLFHLLPCLNRPWWSKINEQITLSANPLKEDLDLLAREHGAVLSLVEEFETEPHLFGIPIKPENWKAKNIAFLNLPTPDRTPVDQQDIAFGVQFLHMQISQGKKVLVHCQAGVGRSATVVICYLIKHQNMSAEEAVNFVRARRWISVHAESPALKAYSLSAS